MMPTKLYARLQPPISDAVRADYIRKLRQAKSARYIAFRLLALRAVGELQTRLTPFLSELETILLKDSSPLELRQCGSVDDVSKTVNARLSVCAQIRAEGVRHRRTSSTDSLWHHSNMGPAREVPSGTRRFGRKSRPNYQIKKSAETGAFKQS